MVEDAIFLSHLILFCCWNGCFAICKRCCDIYDRLSHLQL